MLSNVSDTPTAHRIARDTALRVAQNHGFDELRREDIDVQPAEITRGSKVTVTITVTYPVLGIPEVGGPGEVPFWIPRQEISHSERVDQYRSFDD